MRTRLVRVKILAAILSIACVGHTQAQMTVNPGALDLLPTSPSQDRRPPPRPAPPRPAAPSPAAPNPAAKPNNAVPAPAAAASVPKPVLPTVPPAIAALPPPAPVPPARPQTHPTIPVTSDAPGAASPLPGGLRVTFGPERQDLNPQTEAALRALAQRLRTDPSTVNIYAYAEGTADDPSTARRLSLGRALAARAVLINEGIASNRIYPRSIGPAPGDADKNRVDVVVGSPGPPASVATARP